MQFVKLMLVILLFVSCNKATKGYTYTILDNEVVDLQTIQQLTTAEKALLGVYLFVYGNECTSSSKSVKCTILKELQINNECNKKYIDSLKSWFKTEGVLYYKLQKCPVLPYKAAIQNQFKKIQLYRNKDTIKITINVVGMNTSQEKNWDITQTNSYIIKNNSFIKINN